MNTSSWAGKFGGFKDEQDMLTLGGKEDTSKQGKYNKNASCSSIKGRQHYSWIEISKNVNIGEDIYISYHYIYYISDLNLKVWKQPHGQRIEEEHTIMEIPWTKINWVLEKTRGLNIRWERGPGSMRHMGQSSTCLCSSLQEALLGPTATAKDRVGHVKCTCLWASWLIGWPGVRKKDTETTPSLEMLWRPLEWYVTWNLSWNSHVYSKRGRERNHERRKTRSKHEKGRGDPHRQRVGDRGSSCLTSFQCPGATWTSYN